MELKDWKDKSQNINNSIININNKSLFGNKKNQPDKNEDILM